MSLSTPCQSWRMPDELWEKVKPSLPPGKLHNSIPWVATVLVLMIAKRWTPFSTACGPDANGKLFIAIGLESVRVSSGHLQEAYEEDGQLLRQRAWRYQLEMAIDGFKELCCSFGRKPNRQESNR